MTATIQSDDVVNRSGNEVTGGQPQVRIRSGTSRAVEIASFATLCSEDYEFLGVPDGALRSNFEHCAEVVRTADRLGYQNILLPSSYEVGQDPLLFAAAMASHIKQISQLVAVRCGEIHPPMLARAISTLDHLLRGRLNINIISSDLPGTKTESAARYRKSGEVIEILKQAWTQDHISFKGEFYNFELESRPVKPYQQNGGPLLYFGGISPAALELAARHCDVYLMWPETEQMMAQTIRSLSAQAAAHGRRIDFGLRIHLIVRETEAEARAAADRLISRLDPEKGREIKNRSLHTASAGTLRQDQLRAASSDLYIEPNVWSGIGLARSGCGSAIVGDPDQVHAKLQRYIDIGFRSFIFSGYPHIDECERFARWVLPRLQTCRFAEVQGRLPSTEPVTPLTTAPRQ
jgi:alkanesulfonate monooxygenase